MAGKLVKGVRRYLINTRRKGVPEEESEERGKFLAEHSLLLTHREIEQL